MSIVDTGLKSTISYTPLVADISAFILAGNGVDALNAAISQLVDAGVDWVLDAPNSRVKYGGGGAGTYPASYGGRPVSYGATPYDAALEHCSLYGGTLESTPRRDDESFYLHYCSAFGDSIVIPKSSYIPPTEKYIPIETVATQILADAIAGNTASQAALTQITLDKFASNDFAVELDDNAVPYS